jgi:hypothetical protein
MRFFQNNGEYYGAEYAKIPAAYRDNYEIDMTYYPDGTQPVNLKTAEPPLSREIAHDQKNAGVLLMRYNELKQNDADPERDEFWADIVPAKPGVDVPNTSKYTLNFNVFNKVGVSSAKLPNTDEKIGLQKFVVLMIGSAVILACVVGILYTTVSRQKE